MNAARHRASCGSAKLMQNGEKYNFFCHKPAHRVMIRHISGANRYNCERPSFGTQETAFHNAKDGLSHGKRRPFANCPDGGRAAYGCKLTAGVTASRRRPRGLRRCLSSRSRSCHRAPGPRLSASSSRHTPCRPAIRLPRAGCM